MRTYGSLSSTVCEVEATTGFEPVIGVLQTPALTTWLRRLETITTRGGVHAAAAPCGLFMVPRRGFEPLRPKARPPQDRVSTNSTTSAVSLLAGVEGLEPTTCGFGDRCSSS